MNPLVHVLEEVTGEPPERYAPNTNSGYDYLVIDCHLLAYACWWPCRELCTGEGVHTGLEYGFVKGILALARTFHPSQLILVWDGKPTRCSTIFPIVKDEVSGVEVGYKSNRTAHESKDSEAPWTPRLNNLRELFSRLCIQIYHPEMEADEQIASFVHWASQRGKRSLIVSKDRDLQQLVRDDIHVTGGIEKPILDPRGIVELWGVPAEKLSLYRAVKGDSSDGMKGVPRLPTEITVNLVNNSSSIVELVHNAVHGALRTAKQLENFLASKDRVLMNHLIGDLSSQFAVKPHFMALTEPSNQPMFDFLTGINCVSLLYRKEWDLFHRSVEEVPQEIRDFVAEGVPDVVPVS